MNKQMSKGWWEEGGEAENDTEGRCFSPGSTLLIISSFLAAAEIIRVKVKS